MLRFPYQFPIGKCSKIHRIDTVWEIGTHTFHKVWVLFSIRFPSHQFTIASSPDKLELKANQIKRRIGGGCNFIKREENKYTLGKSIPSNTRLSLLLTIDSKNYNSYPKISTKSPAIVAIGRKVSEGSSFK